MWSSNEGSLSFEVLVAGMERFYMASITKCLENIITSKNFAQYCCFSQCLVQSLYALPNI